MASSLRPDTILKRDGATYILDAKMYQYGVTKDVRDLPETQSIQKQITYGDHVFNTLDKSDNPKVRNVFVLLSIPLSEVHAIRYRSPHNPLKKSIFF